MTKKILHSPWVHGEVMREKKGREISRKHDYRFPGRLKQKNKKRKRPDAHNTDVGAWKACNCATDIRVAFSLLWASASEGAKLYTRWSGAALLRTFTVLLQLDKPSYSFWFSALGILTERWKSERKETRAGESSEKTTRSDSEKKVDASVTWGVSCFAGVARHVYI